MTKLRLTRDFPGRKLRLILAVLLVLVMLAAALWSFSSAKNETPESVQQENWIHVQPQKIEQHLGLVGRIQAARQETLSAPFAGIIQEIAVREGESVTAGQVLLRLDPSQIDIQLRLAQADLLKAQRDVQQLRTWRQSPDVARARRGEQASRAALETTQTNLRDTRALFERGIVARMEVDALVQQLRMQQQDLLTAQEELRTTEARGQGEERKIAEMELLNAQARHQALVTQRHNQTLTSPFTGVVTRPDVSEGGKVIIAQQGLMVSQGAPLLAVTGMEKMQVIAQVEESDLNLLLESMPAEITGDGFPGQALSGHISGIAFQSNSSASSSMGAFYDVVVTIDTPHSSTKPPLRPGMNARVAIVIYRNEQGIAVPPNALHTDKEGNVWVVYRATPDSPSSRVNVEPGQAVSQGIEVKGIQPGYILVPAT